jgi:hypothetical protein
MEKCRKPLLDLSEADVGEALDLDRLPAEEILWAGDGAGRFPLSLASSQSDIAAMLCTLLFLSDG